MTDGDPRSARRDAGLRRVSRLTWRAALLSAVGMVGFVSLFHHSADVATAASQASARPGVASSGSAVGRAGASGHPAHSAPAAHRAPPAHRAAANTAGKAVARHAGTQASSHRKRIAPPARPPARSKAPAHATTSGSAAA
jgi:hypothetical protein